MTFRRDLHKFVYVKWDGKSVRPKTGHFTVLYWLKGDRSSTIDGDSWVAADVYGPDGRIYLCGVLAQSLDELKRDMPSTLETYVPR